MTEFDKREPYKLL